MSTEHKITVPAVSIKVNEHILEGKTLYGWSLKIEAWGVDQTSEYYYATPMEALKKAQAKLYGYIKNLPEEK